VGALALKPLSREPPPAQTTSSSMNDTKSAWLFKRQPNTSPPRREAAPIVMLRLVEGGSRSRNGVLRIGLIVGCCVSQPDHYLE
jgi:hypothetical protein